MWTTDSESHFDAHFPEYMGLLAAFFDLHDASHHPAHRGKG
jgi:hypothetical protein